MPRSLEEILAHADELAEKFVDDFEPTEITEIDPLEGLQRAVIELSNSQRNVKLWVVKARAQGKSWKAIGKELGTTGEAARQRYSEPSKTVGHPRPMKVANLGRTDSPTTFKKSAAAKKPVPPKTIAAKRRGIAASAKDVKRAVGDTKGSKRAAGKR
ncbi:hypothetical protein [Nocardia nova]|uniref:hypothetical protein n=1 Tax=Nocardia nova TaxID=37330 RepID=UPI0015E29885|nr:hypothetical protein [Nocardia nova]